MKLFLPAMVFISAVFSADLLYAQDEAKPRQPPSTKVLTKDQWKQVDDSVGRGINWLATQQQDNGSFQAIDRAQPAVTAFSVMAFLAQGQSPNDGRYTKQLTKAINFIADQQKPNGLIATIGPTAAPIPRDTLSSEGPIPQSKPNYVAVTAVYNHAISALALCEAYGQCNAEQAKRLAPVIERAIAATLEMQRWGSKRKEDVGGWRYLTSRNENDSDLSITGWQLMFLRSAKDAGFDVPKASIDAAVKYIENCFLQDADRRVHAYLAGRRFTETQRTTVTRSMAGAGILAMAHAGKHNSEEAVASGDWILKHGFSDYDMEHASYGIGTLNDRYLYGAILCTQGMYQLGGKYWEQFFPPLVNALMENQQKDGSWLTRGKDRPYGGCYTTSLSILSLSVPSQMLPIFQR